MHAMSNGQPAHRRDPGTPRDGYRTCGSGDADEHESPRQRFHVEVYVAPEVAEQRIAAAVAAGGTVVDDNDGAVASP